MTNEEITDRYRNDMLGKPPRELPRIWGSLISYLATHDRERFIPIDKICRNKKSGTTLDSVLLYKETYNDTIFEYNLDTILTIINI